MYEANKSDRRVMTLGIPAPVARATKLRDALKDASAAIDDWAVGEYAENRPPVEAMLVSFNDAFQVLLDFTEVFKLVKFRVTQVKLQDGRQIRYERSNKDKLLTECECPYNLATYVAHVVQEKKESFAVQP